MTARKIPPGEVFTQSVDDEAYASPAGASLAREYGTKSPNGNTLNGHWVLRDADGTLIDFDKYRHDLAERNDVRLSSSKSKVMFSHEPNAP